MAACTGGGKATPSPTPAGPPTTATFVDGQTFVAVRTLPLAALAANQLQEVGAAMDPGGGPVSLSRAHVADVADWELVSPSPDGWRVWQPQAVIDALAAAGTGASIVSVARTSWPNACLGLAHPLEVCPQVVTQGYTIVVSRGGKQMEYHTDLTNSNGSMRLATQP